MTIELRWGAHTDTGRRRQRNEDAFLVAPPVFAVADGMGGHARGDVAAAMAVQALEGLVGRDGTAPAADRAAVLDAIRVADRAIHQTGLQADGHGMGTTLCGLVAALDSSAPAVLVFNVGDSRAYCFRAGRLRQISKDHSVVQELLDAGQIDASQAGSHPERNVVTRSLGSGEPLEIDWWSVSVQADDRWLLCSDGLVKEIEESQITDLLVAAATPQSAAERLVAAAVACGGRDNVTAVVIDVAGVSPPVDPALDADTNPRRPSDDTRPRPGSSPEGDHHLSEAN